MATTLQAAAEASWSEAAGEVNRAPTPSSTDTAGSQMAPAMLMASRGQRPHATSRGFSTLLRVTQALPVGVTKAKEQVIRCNVRSPAMPPKDPLSCVGNQHWSKFNDRSLAWHSPAKDTSPQPFPLPQGNASRCTLAIYTCEL